MSEDTKILLLALFTIVFVTVATGARYLFGAWALNRILEAVQYRRSDWRWTLLVAVAPTLVTELFNTARWAAERREAPQPDRTGTIWERPES